MHGVHNWVPLDCVMHVRSFIADPKDLRSLGKTCQVYRIIFSQEGLTEDLTVNSRFVTAIQRKFDYRGEFTKAISSRTSLEIKAWCQVNAIPQPSDKKMQRILEEVLQKHDIDAILASHAAMCVKFYTSNENYHYFRGKVPIAMKQIGDGLLPVTIQHIRGHKEGLRAILRDPAVEEKQFDIDQLTVDQLKRKGERNPRTSVKKVIPDGKAPSTVRILSSDLVCSFLDSKSLKNWTLTCRWTIAQRMMSEYCEKIQYGIAKAEQMAAQSIVLCPKVTLGKILRIRDLFIDGSERFDEAYIEGCVRSLSVQTIHQMLQSTFSPLWNSFKSLNQKEFLRQIYNAWLIHQHLMRHLDAVKAIAREPE